MKKSEYNLLSVYEVNGRQGICKDNEFYYVSGSKSLSKYDKDFNLVLENDDPFKGIDIEVNHIGDIDVYNDELYLGVEYFDDGVGKNLLEKILFGAEIVVEQRLVAARPLGDIGGGGGIVAVFHEQLFRRLKNFLL